MNAKKTRDLPARLGLRVPQSVGHRVISIGLRRTRFLALPQTAFQWAFSMVAEFLDGVEDVCYLRSTNLTRQAPGTPAQSAESPRRSPPPSSSPQG